MRMVASAPVEKSLRLSQSKEMLKTLAYVRKEGKVSITASAKTLRARERS
jgi:hypothetical protein